MTFWILVAVIILVVIALARSSFEIRSEIKINASPAQVWIVITGLANYHKWNTQLEYLGGQAALGANVNLRLSIEGADPYEFAPTINRWNENKTFSWIARTGLPFIFDGEHFFELSGIDRKTFLMNRETYSGILSPFIKRQPMMKSAPKGFNKMNQELKDYIEKNLNSHINQQIEQASK